MDRDRFEGIKAKIVAHKEKATDLDINVRQIMQLPYGQLKKDLTDKVMAVLAKYGYTE
jgi:hypothetical protein